MIIPLRHSRGIVVLACLFAGVTAAFAATPALSPKVRDLIDRFFAPPEFQDVQLSPTGSHLAFFKELDGRLVLATHNFKTNKLALTNPAPGQKVVNFDWVSPDQILFEYIQENFKQDRPLDFDLRYETVDIQNVYLGHWLVDADLKKLQEIPKLGVIYEMVDPLPQDPANVLLTEQAYDKFFGPLYHYDPSKNKIELAERNPGRVLRWHTDVAGKVRLATVAGADGDFSLSYRETEKSPWQPLPVPANTRFLSFDMSGQHLLLAYPNDAGRYVVQPYDLPTKKLLGQPIADPVYDVDPDVIRDPRTGAARGLTFETERLKFIWLDPQFKQLQTTLAAALPGAIIVPVGLTQAGDILVSASSDISPLEYYLFNPKTGKMQLFMDRRPKVRDLTLAPMKPIAFKVADGAELHGYLTLPPGHDGKKPLPLIALVHGGPRTRDSWGYDSEVQYFAALGYAVLQVNYRGSAGYGRDYMQPNIIETGQRSVDDIAESLRWAVAQGIADPKRLVVCGGSYGGYIALGIATRYPDLPACVIGFAGVYDWEFHNRVDRAKLTEYYKWATDYFPSLKENAARYRAISPVHQAEAVKAPVLLIHGRKDQRVDIGQSELMATALRKAGKSVEILKDADGVHGLPDEKLRRTYYERVTTFLLQYAPPDKLP